MSFIFADSCEYYNEKQDIYRKWDAASAGYFFNVNQTGNRYGGPCIGSDSTLYKRVRDGNNDNYLVMFFISFMMKWDGDDAYVVHFYNTKNGAKDPFGWLRIDSNGNFYYQSDEGTLVTSTLPMTEDLWTRVDVAIRANKADYDTQIGGRIIVRQNGYETINYPGNVIGSYENDEERGMSGIALNLDGGYFDDILIYDNIVTGDGFDSFIPDFHIQPLRPTANHSVQFTSNDATDNFDVLNNQPVDFQSDEYLYADTTGKQDWYLMERMEDKDLDEPPQIHGILTNVWALRKGDANCKIQTTIDKNGNVVYSTPHFLSYGKYKCCQDFRRTDPDGLIWNRDTIDNLKVGIRTVS
jgi:hypothetical protein